MMKYALTVGTYSQKKIFPNGKIIDGKGLGIYFLEYNPLNREFSTDYIIEDFQNPSYIATFGDTLVVVNEVDTFQQCKKTGGITIYKDSTKECAKITNGVDPCYVAVSPKRNYIVACNYTGGSLTVYRYEKGELEQTDFIQYKERIINGKEVTPHIHSAYFNSDGSLLIVIDLGTETITSYSFESGKVKMKCCLSLPSGFAPRHAVIVDDMRVYVLSEKRGEIAIISLFKNGRLKLNTVISVKNNQSCYSYSEIHHDKANNILMVADRITNSIERYTILKKGEMLEKLDEIIVENSKPRSFAISNDGLYVFICEQANNIVSAWRNEKNRLIKESSIVIPSCVCIKEREE